MWFVREIRILRDAGKTAEAVEKVCKRYNISIAHAEDIIRELSSYQVHDYHDPLLDKKVKDLMKTGDKVAACKEVRAKHNDGLLSAKLYIEDILNNLKPWPPVPVTKARIAAEDLLREIFGDK